MHLHLQSERKFESQNEVFGQRWESILTSFHFIYVITGGLHASHTGPAQAGTQYHVFNGQKLPCINIYSLSDIWSCKMVLL